MAVNIIDEYLISLKPSADMKAWDDITAKIRQRVTGGLRNLYTGQGKLDDITGRVNSLKQKIADGDTSEQTVKELELATEAQKQQSQVVNANNAKLQAAGIALSLFSEMVNWAAESAEKLAEASADVSNKYVSQSSIFVDKNIRDTMAKFGTDAETAQAISAVSSGLGIDMGEYSKLTAGQRKAFDDLMAHYQAGLDKLEPEKLDRFNKATQEYQLKQLEFEMDLQLVLQKLLVNSDAVPRLLDTMGDAMDNISTIMSSDVFVKGSEIIIDIINGILQFATTPISWLGNIMGGGKSSTTNNDNSTTNNNINITQNGTSGNSSRQIAIDLGVQIQNALTR